MQVVQRRAFGSVRLLVHHRTIDGRVLSIDLAAGNRPMIEIAQRGEHRAEQQVIDALERMHQHRIVGRLTDGVVKGVVVTRQLLGIRQHLIALG